MKIGTRVKFMELSDQKMRRHRHVTVAPRLFCLQDVNAQNLSDGLCVQILFPNEVTRGEFLPPLPRNLRRFGSGSLSQRQ